MLQSTRIDSHDLDQNLHQDDTRRRGATMMEYLMMMSLIIVVCLVGIGYFGQSTNNTANAASNAISKSLKKGS